MLVLLLRHADAGMPDPVKWPGDVDRPLSDTGHSTQRAMGELLRGTGIAVEAVLTSPLLRARQTAAITAEVLGLTPPVVCDALAAPPNMRALSKCIASIRADTIALVGHSPWLEQLASILLAGSPDGMSIDFPKSAAMAIRADTLDPGAGELIAFAPPSLARA